jgi:hypothetical protein
MSYYRVPCTQASGEKPELTEKFSENIEIHFSVSKAIPLIMAFCPHCGSEIVYEWSYFYVFISSQSRFHGDTEAEQVEKKAKEWIENTYRPNETRDKIIDELKAFFQQRMCPRCRKKLSFAPGYFYFSSGSIKYEEFLVQPFMYDDYESVKPFLQESKFAGSYSDVYSYNKLTEEFFRPIADEQIYQPEAAMLYFNLLPIEEEAEKEKNNPSSTIRFNLVRHSLSIEKGFELLRFFRKRLYPMDNRVDDLINNETVVAESELISIDKNKISDAEEIKKFLQFAIWIETDYFALKKRLPDLYFIQKEMTLYKNNVLFNDTVDLMTLYQSEQELKAAEEKLAKLQETQDLWKTYLSQFSVQPVSCPKEPGEPKQPTLETPGLFNKKKVQAENDAKMAQYRNEFETWKKKHEEWASECALIKQQNEAKEQEAEKAAKEKAESELRNAEQSVKDNRDRIQQAREAIDRKIELKKQEAEEDIWDKDVRETEALLKQCIHARVQYQMSNIIFPKYQDLVAYSTFYEYFETGRCNSLSGPDGAYNLYESEIRQNTIISQLSTVIDSLEAIKNNQYMVYTQLTKMNESLDRLNSSMDRALDTLETTLSNIDQNVNSINEYAKVSAQNSEVIAYNTAATAYYTKKNAELTDAMGYLVAFK